jgi:hypothetical protein
MRAILLAVGMAAAAFVETMQPHHWLGWLATSLVVLWVGQAMRLRNEINDAPLRIGTTFDVALRRCQAGMPG